MEILFWIAILSQLSGAAAMGVIVWRTARDARGRELARVELLKALAFPDAFAAAASGQAIPNPTAGFRSEQATSPVVDAYEPEAPIFSEHAQPLTALPRWISLSAVGAAMALGATLFAVVADGPKVASTATPASAAPATADARTTVVPDKPIEVIALEYRFGRATAFHVSGRIRNPANGRALPQLMAVVDLLDADGRILSSQMTPLEQPVLEAGQTSAFSLAFPRVTGTVARYKVVFRLHGLETIPQIDRRGAEPAANGSSS